MNRTLLSLAGLVTLAGVVLAVVAIPGVEAGYDSATEALLRTLHRQLLAVAIPLGVLVEAALFYAMLKFHGNDDPAPTEESRRLEVAWTIGVAVILLFVGASSYLVFADPMVSTAPGATPQADDVEVEITGQNWYWSVSYPGENVTTRNLLVLPANRTVFFTVTSRDVIHSVHIPGLGIKQDAVPGQTTTYRTRLTDRGAYRLYCAEFCGTGHSTMIAEVRVVSQSEYRRWLRQNGSAARNDSSNSSVASIYPAASIYPSVPGSTGIERSFVYVSAGIDVHPSTHLL